MNDFQLGIEYLERDKASCVLIKNGEVLYESFSRGIYPLYDAHVLKKLDLEGGVLADRVIGKAAAMIAHHAGVVAIHGEVMSDHAIEYLSGKGIQISHKKNPPFIKNREKTGMCPIETRALSSSSYEEMIEKVEEFLRSVNMI